MNVTESENQQWLGQAASHHQAGRLKEAELLYRKVLKSDPDNADALHLLGVVAHQSGHHDAAVDLIAKAINLKSSVAAYHANQGSAYLDGDRAKEAAVCYRRAIALAPENAAAFYNLARALQRLGSLEEAEQACQAAIRHQPVFAEAHMVLGNLVKGAGRGEEALGHYETAIFQKDDLADAHRNLGVMQLVLGRRKQALFACRRAVDLDPENDAYRQSLVSCYVGGFEDLTDDRTARDLHQCLLFWADAKGLGRAVAGALKSLPAFREFLDPAAGFNEPAFDAAWPDEGVPAALNHPLLLDYLERECLPDMELEHLLQNSRRRLLMRFAADDGPTMGEQEAAFLAALASQCFQNEYLYDEDEDETRRLDDLRAAIRRALDAGSDPDYRPVALLAAYRPLAREAFARELLDRHAPEERVREIMVTQIEEPLREQKIKGDISTVTKITDGISRSVREQYEENPYPRWRNVAVQPTASLAKHLSRKLPVARLEGPLPRDPAQILVAGCGTGQHPILTASVLADSHVTALDLSLASLAFAKRKALESGVGNIDFVHGDILELAGWGRTFGVIECTGVLHHMRDPVAGWRALLAILEDDGIMKLGLYSDIARQAVVAARLMIAERGYPSTLEGMRRCRREIGALPDAEMAKKVLNSADFYAASACRDLLFHVQEHRTTLPEIAGILDQLELEFLGFIIADPAVLHRYLIRFPDDETATSLDSWHQFEQEFPVTFAGLYQFYVRRRA